MDKTRTALTACIITILSVGMIVLVIYHNSELEKQNNSSKGQLITSLGVVEIKGKDSNLLGTPSPIPHNYLYITGIVNNTAKNTIYNAGFHVIAYDSEGNLMFNMTFPLALRGIFGSDNATSEFVLMNYGTNFVSREVLGGNETVYVTMSILHEGTATNWTITPVWTDIP